MKKANKESGNKTQRPQSEKPVMKTIEDVIAEIKEVVDNALWEETKLAKLRAMGFAIENCWVKNGSIGVIWHMKRKRVFRIQVTDSVAHGKYHKASCVIIPVSDIKFQKGDALMVRNSALVNNTKSNTSTLVTNKTTTYHKRKDNGTKD